MNTHKPRTVAADLDRPLATDRLRAAERHMYDAERHMYDAEVALHIAHQSHVDSWIGAAADRLHEAILAHTAAQHAAGAA